MDPAAVATADDGTEPRLVVFLPNDLGAIEMARIALLEFVQPLGLSPTVINRIEVIVEEVVSNIVRHGFHPGSMQSIRFTATASDPSVCLMFDDDGVAFDPLARAAPTRATTLESATLGGLGIPLVIRLATDVSYRSPVPSSDSEAGFQPNNELTVIVAR